MQPVYNANKGMYLIWKSVINVMSCILTVSSVIQSCSVSVASIHTVLLMAIVRSAHKSHQTVRPATQKEPVKYAKMASKS